MSFGDIVYIAAMILFVYMTFGIIEGYLGKQSAFVRTPKFGTSPGLLKRVKQGYNFKKVNMLNFYNCCAFLTFSRSYELL